MTTSLAIQLKKLALPESNLQSDKKKKASLLFDASKAASLDREKFYNIGKEGLEGLIELEPAFSIFSDTLFDLSSQFLERTTESKDVNKNLNKNIQKFLRLLSPYLLLKHSHKALEWLICRYQIHNFNADDLMALIFPYHESKIFVKILQLFNLNYFPQWKWLNKIKKKGVHLPRSVLVNHAFSNSSFLRFICDLTLKTISENKKHNCAKKLGTLFSFYGSTLITFLSRETVNDQHLTIILPSLVKSLKSELIDFKAAGYMILGQLVSTNQITTELLNNFMEILFNQEEEALINEKIFLLIVIFQTQKPPPDIKFDNLEKLSILSKQLPSLANEGVQVGPLLLKLLEACFTCINDCKENLVDAQVLSYTLATEVTCDLEHIKILIRLIDSSYEKLMKEKNSNNYKNQDSNMIKWIKELMNAVFEKYREDLDVEVFDKEFKKLREKWRSTDESILEDPIIMKLIKKCQGEDKESAWLQLRPLLLEKVYNEKIFEALCKVAPFYDNLVLLLCLQKLLHPKYSDEKKLGILSKIFKSKFGGNNLHIQEVNNLLMKNKTQEVSEVVELYFLQLKDSENVIEFEPWLATLLEMKQMDGILDTSEIWSFGLKILLAALPKAFNATYALQLMSILLSLKRKKIKNRFEILKAVIAYISANKKKETKWFDLSKCDSEVWLKIRVLEYVIKGVHNDVKYQKEYNSILDEFSKVCFFGQKEFVRLLGAVCCGIPSEVDLNFEYEVSVLFQIYSLHTSWLQLKVNDEAVFNSFKTVAVRQAALKVLSELSALLKNYNAKSDAIIFDKLLMRSEEILSDPNQVNVALYCLLSPSESVQATLPQFTASSLGDTRTLLLETITAEDTPLYVSLGVMKLLETVNSSEIIEKLYTLSNRAFLQSKESEISRKIIFNFWSRVDEYTAEILENGSIWDLAKRCIKHEKCETFCPSVSFLKCITREVFDKLSENRKVQLLEYMMATRSETESSITANAIASVVKRISFDCQIILPIINNIISLCNTISKRREKSVPQTVIDSSEWKNGISLLELIQSKKKLSNTNILIQPLFNMLKFCLDQDEQIAFEYTKQLLLGCLLDCCKKFSSESDDISENTLNVELVVQCLRASPNPQTHHHALMLLSYLSALIPTQVLRNVMAIFTFMGTSVARLDDEHSVKVVTRVVDAVVPELIKAIYFEQKNLRLVIAEILRVFVWAIKDIPHHRRNPLLLQLLTTMQPENCLWIFLLLLFENHISQDGDNNKTESNNMPTNLYYGLELSLSTSTKNVLDSVVKILSYLEELPVSLMNKEGRTQQQNQIETNKKSNGLFDIDSHTPKQLRHFCYTILIFLNNLLGDNKFVLQLRTECESDKENVESALKETLASLLKYIPFVRKQLTKNQTKFWKAMTHQCYEILDKFVLLTPNKMLLNVIKDLLNHPMKPLRRKALDLLNSFIQSNQNLTKHERQCLKQLLEPTIKIVNTIAIDVEQEEILLQQTALLTLKLLAKLFSSENTEIFKKVLINICGICESNKIHGPLLGSLMLTIAELVTCLKAYSVSEIPSFMPLMLKVFSSNSNPETFNEIGLNSITVAIHRVIEVIPNFLSPYLGDILFGICTVSEKMKEKYDLIKKFFQIRQKLASNIEHRILIPAISKTYKKLIESKEYQSVGPLFDTLSSSFSNLTDIPGVLPDVSQLFISALSFRSDCEIESVEASMDDLNKVEENVINSLVQFVLKLSESYFKSLYYQIFHWASEHKDRMITFFRLSHALAENLKGLFVLFAGYFLQKAASLLDAVNISKTKEIYFNGDSKSETKSIILLQHILQTLHSVFLYDSSESSNFLNKDKFEVLLHPLVDQLENTLGGIEELEKRTATLLTPCLAQMALATDDTLWKSLNYEIILKTKSIFPQIRIGALETIVAIASKLCEDYLMLLPETIGSLAELLEDEDEKVENAMKIAIQRLEDVLGQPVREYFQ